MIKKKQKTKTDKKKKRKRRRETSEASRRERKGKRKKKIRKPLTLCKPILSITDHIFRNVAYGQRSLIYNDDYLTKGIPPD